jgi:hypothetical protein
MFHIKNPPYTKATTIKVKNLPGGKDMLGVEALSSFPERTSIISCTLVNTVFIWSSVCILAFV